MPRKKTEYFTEKMGKEIYVFPPTIGDIHDCKKAIMKETIFRNAFSKVHGRNLHMHRRISTPSPLNY